MRKTVLVTAIIVGVIFFVNTAAFAGGQHYKPRHWWHNPFTKLWNAVVDLQDRMDEMSNDIANLLVDSPQGEPSPMVTAVCPGCFFGGQDLSGAQLPGAHLYMARMTNANFSGANLTDANLVGASLGGCDLTGAILIGTDLSNAQDGDSATWDGVIWGNTTCPDGSNSDDENNAGTCVNNMTP